MTRFSRRDFVGLAGAGLAAATVPSYLRAAIDASIREADFVILNASVYTVDRAQPTADAIAIRADRIVGVGSNAEVRNLVGRNTRVIDAQGMTVVPGFIDCHNHAVGEVLLFEVLVGNPFDVEFVTIASIVDKLREKASRTPPGYVVEGFFYDDTKVKDKRPITLQDLDSVSREHPVAVHHRGGHTSYYNSKAFELAGVTRDTPNPPGGTYDKDAAGNLNGRVTDQALAKLRAAGMRPAFSDAEARKRSQDGMAHISKQFVRYGLTSVHHESGPLASLQEVRARGGLLHRVNYQLGRDALESMIATGTHTGLGDEWLRIGATMEHTVDGSFSERTMALSIPYPGRKDGYKGNLTETQEVLDAWVERVHRAGIQINCHANGDVAIDATLTAIERAQKAFPVADARPKITHCTLINDDLVRRIKQVGAVPMPFTTYAYYNADKFHFYGEDLMRRSMAYRSFVDAGITPAAGSDFSPGPFAPLMGIQGMVTRTGWNGEKWGVNQRVSVDEAIRINTLNGAYASHEENIKGSITIGKLADFVILDKDPHKVPVESIKDIKIVRTVTGGRNVYEA